MRYTLQCATRACIQHDNCHDHPVTYYKLRQIPTSLALIIRVVPTPVSPFSQFFLILNVN